MQKPDEKKTFQVDTTIGISLIVGVLFNFGMVYQQMQQVSTTVKENAALLTIVRENQINGLANLSSLKTEQTLQTVKIESLDKRITVIERHIIIMDKK